MVEQQFALFIPLAHALPVLLPVILPPVPHQWNERLFDQTSLPLNASHTIGLRRPPHQLAEPKHVLALESPLTFEIAHYEKQYTKPAGFPQVAHGQEPCFAGILPPTAQVVEG